MKKFKVYAERTESLCAIIEADSEEEAERYADEYYSDCDWSDCDGTLSTEILFRKQRKQMSNYIMMPLTEVILKAGDRVRLVEPEVLIERSKNPDIAYHNDNGIYSFELGVDAITFKSVDIDDEILTELYKWDTQEIESIDADGDIKFVDMPYIWPKEVILEPVDENDVSLKNYIDSSKIDYIRIYKDEVNYNTFLDYCSMPHAVISNDKESVYFYTISQSNVNPSKHLGPE